VRIGSIRIRIDDAVQDQDGTLLLLMTVSVRHDDCGIMLGTKAANDILLSRSVDQGASKYGLRHRDDSRGKARVIEKGGRTAMNVCV
jgi:hypothetical protein